MARRVVVTGIGPVTPVGTGLEEFWQGLTSGRNGIVPIERFDASDLPVKLAGEVTDFDPSPWMDTKEIRRTDRFVQFAMASAALAWQDARSPVVPAERGGVVFATGIGGIATLLAQHRVLLDKGPGRVSPFMVPALMANAASGHIAMRYGFTGPNLCTVSACSSSNHAIGEAMRYIRDDHLDVCIAGGSEAATLPLTIAAFAQMTALTKNPDPETASRPFDAARDGFVLSEGACSLILESESHARDRGARIYCEVAGYGASDDAFHITAPDPKGSGAALAMEWALRDAGEEPEAVSYVNAHGTSTQLNDAAETGAIKAALGEEVAHRVLVSSTKSMTGHMLGAAGAVEGAACALAIAEGVVPPTIHYATPDPDCDLDVVPNEARTVEVSLALSNSFGFGGHNAVVAFRRAA
ncbi:MAG TPA: beta-ketoacyl-ACP synthase II [Actinomycetota bacterium]|jgi:3-oxoacyl-[acyl-carrier-protein] synthase II|nr:beta-ketoacyl-ACP synthase II [Actinomycetota bacterium]